jgi:hypothetical protein
VIAGTLNGLGHSTQDDEAVTWSAYGDHWRSHRLRPAGSQGDSTIKDLIVADGHFVAVGYDFDDDNRGDVATWTSRNGWAWFPWTAPRLAGGSVGYGDGTALTATSDVIDVVGSMNDAVFHWSGRIEHTAPDRRPTTPVAHARAN